MGETVQVRNELTKPNFAREQLELDDFSNTRADLVPRQRTEHRGGQHDAMRRVEGSDLVLIRTDVDRALAAYARVCLRKQSSRNQLPADPSCQNRRDETADVLHHPTTHDHQIAVAPDPFA